MFLIEIGNEVSNELELQATYLLTHFTYNCTILLLLLLLLPSFLGSTAQLRSWPPPQNPAEFRGGFSTLFFFTG
jgi:hypothetical protein